MSDSKLFSLCNRRNSSTKESLQTHIPSPRCLTWEGSMIRHSNVSPILSANLPDRLRSTSTPSMRRKQRSRILSWLTLKWRLRSNSSTKEWRNLIMSFQAIALSLIPSAASVLQLRHPLRVRTCSNSRMIRLCRTSKAKRVTWMRCRKTKMNCTKQSKNWRPK